MEHVNTWYTYYKEKKNFSSVNQFDILTAYNCNNL